MKQILFALILFSVTMARAEVVGDAEGQATKTEVFTIQLRIASDQTKIDDLVEALIMMNPSSEIANRLQLWIEELEAEKTTLEGLENN